MVQRLTLCCLPLFLLSFSFFLSFSLFSGDTQRVFMPEKRKGSKMKNKEWSTMQLLEEVAKCLVDVGISENVEQFLRIMVNGRFNVT